MGRKIVEKRDRKNKEMDKIEVGEVTAEINVEEIQSDPQNEITENVEILGDQQTKNTKKKRNVKNKKKVYVGYAIFG